MYSSLCIFFAFVALHEGGGAHIVFSFFGRDVTAKDKGCKNRDVIRSFLLSLALSLSCALHSPKSATAALSTFACK